LVWQARIGAVVPASELASGRGKVGGSGQSAGVVGHAGLSFYRLAPLGSALLLALGMAPGAAYALPTGGNVVAGQASIATSGDAMTVQQSSAKAIINWQGFGIGAQQTVRFEQPSSSSVALNRVVGNDPSAIYGHLYANGQVFLVNPNGIYFAPGAEVNVGGLVASTLNISNKDFLDGNYTFTGSSTHGVLNAAQITALKGGYVAFIGNHVSNTGSITAPEGQVALGAGQTVTLTFAGNAIESFDVSASALDAEVANGGAIRANGGMVILSASARNALLKTVVNNTGLIEAQTVADHNGTIELLGGQSGAVQVGGTLDASAPNGGNGGTIETSGHEVNVASTAKIDTSAASGKAGQWTIDPVNFVIGTGNNANISPSTLESALASGNVTLSTTASGTNCTGASCTTTGLGSNGNINVNGSVSWGSHTLTLSAYNNIFINAPLTLTGTTGSNGLTLKYGQGSANGVVNGATAYYEASAPVNLQVGQTFQTQLGSNSANLKSYTIINALGSSNGSTANSLQGMSQNLSQNYALGTTISAKGTSSWNNGAGFTPVGNSTTPYSGSFAGLGHSITDLYIKSPNTTDVGLFGALGQGGAVQDLVLSNATVIGTAATGVGALVGSNQGTLLDIYSSGNQVSGGNKVGGLVGINDTGSISNSILDSVTVSGGASVGGVVGSNTAAGSTSVALVSGVRVTGGSVTGTSQVGGLVGVNVAGAGKAVVTVSSNAGASVSGSTVVGGAVGSNVGGAVTSDTVGSISVSGTGANGSNTAGVGGLVGVNTAGGQVLNANSGATVTAQGQDAGGLVGANLLVQGKTPSLVSNGKASGSVTGSNAAVGGVVGYNNATVINVEYVTGTVKGTGTAVTGGVVGSNAAGASLSYAANQGNSVTGTSNAGGLVGKNAGAISKSFVANLGGVQLNPSANFTAVSVSGKKDVGGLVGQNAGTIGSSFALTNSKGTGNNVGGLVGSNTGQIDQSFAQGTVTASGGQNVGGLVGVNAAGANISNAYSTNSVSGASNVGGLVGNNAGTITDAYQTGGVSGSKTVGGLIGLAQAKGTVTDGYWNRSGNQGLSGVGNGSSNGITGLYSSQLTSNSSFAFNTSGSSGAVWKQYNGNTTPLLTAFLTNVSLTASNQSQVYTGQGSSAGLLSVQYTANNSTVPYKYGVVPSALSSSGTGLPAGIIGAGSPYGTAINVGTYAPQLYSKQFGYNFTISGGQLTITPKALSISLTGVTKTYDGNTAASLTAGNYTVTGFVTGQGASITQSVGTYASSNASNAISVSSALTTGNFAVSGGTQLSNYSFGSTVTGTGAITPKALQVALTGVTKTYDGNTTANLTAGNYSVSGFIAGQGGSLQNTPTV
ncbi:MAG: filamentous hemagglutinin N-terminal domain-containing protein, partial [Candidatus Igneacidithiobacillus chanchocoensis]